MEKLLHIKSDLGIKNSFDKRPNSFQTIPKNDIKKRMLRFKVKHFFSRKHVPKKCFGDVPGPACNQIWQNILGYWDVWDVGDVSTFQTT